MSSRARRIDPASTVSSFPWGGPSSDPLPARAMASAPQTHTIDHEAHLAAREREAFGKGFEQGERAGAEASGERGEATLRRLTETLDELTTVRAEMIRQT